LTSDFASKDVAEKGCCKELGDYVEAEEDAGAACKRTAANAIIVLEINSLCAVAKL
jgi:hypothetical protein